MNRILKILYLNHMKLYIFSLYLFVLLPPLSSSKSTFDTTKIIFHFHGTNTASRIGIRLTSLGDINNDGFDDIAFSSASPRGTYIFYGGNPVDTFPDLFIDGNLGAANPIDLDGDGINDLITSSNIEIWPNPPVGTIYFYKGFVDSISSKPYDSLQPKVDNYGFGAGVKTGYVDSDFLGDFIIYKRNTLGGPTLYYYSGCPTIDTIVDWAYKIENYSHTFSDFGFIDFNGDSQLDIFVGLSALLDSLSFVYIFLGPNFKSNPDFIIGHPVELSYLFPENFAHYLTNIGDIDGDGWDDLGVLFQAHPLIYICGPNSDTLYDYKLDGLASRISKAKDINGDGYNDLLCGDNRVMNGVVDVYLSGVEFDIYFDISIYRSDLPPLFLDRVGWRLAPAGDFNSDGFNDFMFSCQNFAYGEPRDVFIVNGGPYIITDVDDIIEEQRPNEFNLEQNYPNPFNTSTTIEFKIPRRTEVNLIVYNILGENVRTLIRKELQTGSYTLQWDGKDKNDTVVSSGVYFYELTTEKFQDTKKMIMIK